MKRRLTILLTLFMVGACAFAQPKPAAPAAKSALVRLEETMDLLERGRLELPEGADIAAFLLSDGKLAKKPVPMTVEKPLTLVELRDRYV